MDERSNPIADGAKSTVSIVTAIAYAVLGLLVVGLAVSTVVMFGTVVVAIACSLPEEFWLAFLVSLCLAILVTCASAG